MNRAEQAALGPTIKAMCKHNPSLWWELKWQIWDSGNQAFYPRQSEYQLPVQHALERLSDPAFRVLEEEWKKSHPGIASTSASVLRYYEAIVIDEIVRRAEIAGRQTVHW